MSLTRQELCERRIGVLMGGPSAEREVSLNTGRAVLAALLRRGYDAVGIDWQGELVDELRQAGVQLVWNALHGTLGEDGCVQGLLEVLGIPYTGSGVLASALAMDKVAARRAFAAAGLPQPRWCIYRRAADVADIRFPLVVKPSREGSSVGVSIVHAESDLPAALEAALRCRGEVMLERYLRGREVQVGILDDLVLGTVEVRPAGEFYDYQAKYERSDTQYLVPAPLAAAEHDRVSEIGLLAHCALGCSGGTRVDLIVDHDGGIWILEVNTLPGMTSRSLLPKIAAHAGIDYDQLVERIALGAGLATAGLARGDLAPAGRGKANVATAGQGRAG